MEIAINNGICSEIHDHLIEYLFNMQFLLQNAQRVVIKLGSRLLTSGIGKLNVDRINTLCEQVVFLRKKGMEIIIVSSGAIALGMGKLKYKKRPTDLATLQACAAIGQSILIETWQSGFNPHNLTAAQLLLTREDLRARNRHIAVKNSFDKLLSLGIIPIVNENDSVSTEEIKFGDNDVLSALVSSLVKADILVILGLAPGLVDRKGSGKVVPVVDKIDPYIEAMAGETKSETSIGGMRSKVEAAKITSHSGCGIYIGSGRSPNVLANLLQGKAKGTFFVPSKISLVSKKRWIAFFERPLGAVIIDAGANDALLNDGRSLLAKGVKGHRGQFSVGDIITVENTKGTAIANGVSQFSSEELVHISGKDTKEIKISYPNRKRYEIIHRNSLVILAD